MKPPMLIDGVLLVGVSPLAMVFAPGYRVGEGALSGRLVEIEHPASVKIRLTLWMPRLPRDAMSATVASFNFGCDQDTPHEKQCVHDQPSQ
jgi:hypothetical protein